MSNETQIELVLDWQKASHLRRNSTGFNTIKELAAAVGNDQTIKINAFLYAVLCPAKNLDLFLNENVDSIKEPVEEIAEKMSRLEDFEREGISSSKSLEQCYLDIRGVAARPSARDEQRCLALLLFNGPSTPGQIASELGIEENLAVRLCRALDPVVDPIEEGKFALKENNDVRTVVAYLVRSTLGLDPIRVLERLILKHELHANGAKSS